MTKYEIPHVEARAKIDAERRNAHSAELSRIAAKYPDVEIYEPADRTRLWAIIIQGNSIAHVSYEQSAEFIHRVHYSSIHKPNMKIGTGFACGNIEEALYGAPYWTKEEDRAQVRKYANIAAFLAVKSNNWCNYEKTYPCPAINDRVC